MAKFLKTVSGIPRQAEVESWSVKTANYTAEVGDHLAANTSAGSFTITLPVSPVVGSKIRIMDSHGVFGINGLTIGRNGANIMGLAQDYVAKVSNLDLTLVYIDASRGWAIMSNLNLAAIHAAILSF